MRCGSGRFRRVRPGRRTQQSEAIGSISEDLDATLEVKARPVMIDFVLGHARTGWCTTNCFCIAISRMKAPEDDESGSSLQQSHTCTWSCPQIEALLGCHHLSALG